MTGDRDLDAWLADFLGYEEHPFIYSEADKMEHEAVDHSKWVRPGGPIWETEVGVPPSFSSDPDACALLKARLRGKGVSFGVWHESREDEPGTVECYGMDLPENIVADTEELAVARFARALKESGAL